ncbi:histone family protein [Methanosphaera sp.]
MTELPKATMGKLLKEAGATRVSDDAKIELAKVLEEIGEEVGRQSIPFAKHAGRKTIKARDIKLVIGKDE